MKRLLMGLILVGIIIVLGSCETTSRHKVSGPKRDDTIEKPVASPPAGEAGSEDKVSRPSREGAVARGKPSHLATHYSLLIAQLGDDDWRTRQVAHKELIELGEKLIGQYRATRAKKQEISNKSNLPAGEAGSELRTLHSELKTLAQVLREACQDKDAEIRMRAKMIRRHLYVLTQPKIAFVSKRDGNREIYVMDANGKNQKNLTENKAQDDASAWSPDGTKIVFESKRDGNWEIYVMDTDGGNQIRLTQNQVDDWSPAWNPSSFKEISGLFAGRD